MWDFFSFSSPRVVKGGMSFLSRYDTYQGQGFCMGGVHCKTTYQVDVPAALYKLQIRGWNEYIYILYFRHAQSFKVISKAEFQDICGNIMAQKPVVLAF